MAKFRENWPKFAACRIDPEPLFVPGAGQQDAKRICRPCPVRYECLADALDNRIEHGVWGGMTERERRAWLKQFPEIKNWGKAIEDWLDGVEADSEQDQSRSPSILRPRQTLDIATPAGAVAISAVSEQVPGVQVLQESAEFLAK